MIVHGKHDILLDISLFPLMTPNRVNLFDLLLTVPHLTNLLITLTDSIDSYSMEPSSTGQTIRGAQSPCDLASDMYKVLIGMSELSEIFFRHTDVIFFRACLGLFRLLDLSADDVGVGGGDGAEAQEEEECGSESGHVWWDGCVGGCDGGGGGRVSVGKLDAYVEVGKVSDISCCVCVRRVTFNDVTGVENVQQLGHFVRKRSTRLRESQRPTRPSHTFETSAHAHTHAHANRVVPIASNIRISPDHACTPLPLDAAHSRPLPPRAHVAAPFEKRRAIGGKQVLICICENKFDI